MPALSADLILEYCRTEYRVETPDGRHSLFVGREHPEFDAVLRRHGVGTWAVITASNPRSEPLPADENAARNRQLLAAARSGGHVVWPAAGVAADPAWPPEESLLVGDITPEAARELAARFDQHAIVYGQCGRAAELVFLGGEEILPALRAAIKQSDEPARAAPARGADF